MSSRQTKTLFFLRIVIAWIFIYAGYAKVITYFTDAPDWSATSFLTHVSGPFAQTFNSLASNKMIDYLNAYGALAIGLGLLTGTLFRAAAFFGCLLMGLYWLAGFPPEHSLLIDEHIVYISVLLVLSVFAAGRTWGLDTWIEKLEFIKKYPGLRRFLG
ncbi:DoxX family protein [candidate division WWE3 bacterium]|uniref:DoxX family protein n=1 Tax=candidate division WWE3 bacterium TaxID=2053526 RepID=A0A955RQ62_UNCKA|nr:DoxX family protein [candidate division WWE3 bacterium]